MLLGDFVVYFLGYVYGEKVMSLPLTRRLLTRQREAQIKGYFHRHGFKILVSGRFVPGFRTAAYLTAGILKLPALKLLLTDLVAATLSTLLMFGLGFLFANQIQKGIHEVQQWVTLIAAVGWRAGSCTDITGAMRAPGCPSGRRCRRSMKSRSRAGTVRRRGGARAVRLLPAARRPSQAEGTPGRARRSWAPLRRRPRRRRSNWTWGRLAVDDRPVAVALTTAAAKIRTIRGKFIQVGLTRPVGS